MGRFSLVYLQGFEKDIARHTNLYQEEDVSFDLGEVKASRDFYFLLQNQGINPITDVALDTDNANFAVRPYAIDTLKNSIQKTL